MDMLQLVKESLIGIFLYMKELGVLSHLLAI